MPGYDRSGPMGQGPRTGGGFGYCSPRAGGNASGWTGGGVGRGVGRGGRPWGGGRGRCFGGARWFDPRFGPGAAGGYGPVDPLEAENEELRARLKAMEDRLNDLERGGRE